jgi:hypothetical protein
VNAKMLTGLLAGAAGTALFRKRRARDAEAETDEAPHPPQ